LYANHTQMQTAATVSSLRGAARQLEIAAGDIEDHAQGASTSIETVELAWKQADELREIARNLREKADGAFHGGTSHKHHLTSSKSTSTECTAGPCCSAGASETTAVAKTDHCSAEGGCTAGETAAAAADCEHTELPIIAKLPHLGQLFTGSGVAPCEAMPHPVIGVIAPHRRLFTAIRIAPPVTAGAAPNPAELEAAIDQLAQELNELRKQLRVQTSRRVAADEESPE
jgi:hypothetical protein